MHAVGLLKVKFTLGPSLVGYLAFYTALFCKMPGKNAFLIRVGSTGYNTGRGYVRQTLARQNSTDNKRQPSLKKKQQISVS